MQGVIVMVMGRIIKDKTKMKLLFMKGMVLTVMATVRVRDPHSGYLL